MPTDSSHVSDRERAGLRGPVKTVIEEHSTSLPNGKQLESTNTTEYAPDGRKLEERWGNPGGSDWGMKYTYRPDGRLAKTASGKSGSAPDAETTYLYDDAGKLVGLKSGNNAATRYQYDDKGRKSVTQTFEATPLPANLASASHREGTDLGFADYLGGTLTTFYNEHDIATGAEFHDLEGKLVGHIVRQFDSEGRVVSEEQQMDAAPQFPFPEEIRSQLNAEQLKAVGAFAGGMQKRSNSYKYDDKSRVTERHREGGPFDDEVTVTTYNDYGDKASERTTTIMNPLGGQQFSLTDAGAMIPVGETKPPPPPSVYETQYTYQYDGYGNWTEQTTAGRSQSGQATGPDTTRRRKLTYY